MTVREFISLCKQKADTFALKFLTPKEYKAIVLFLSIGFAVFMFRGGKQLWYLMFPPAAPNSYITEQKRQDSIFAALSAGRIPEDSLKFWQPLSPEDSTATLTRRSSKTEGLALASISLNNSTKQELMRLPGVGDVMSERILSYRKQRGGFRMLTEIMNVQGIGEKKFEKMKPYLKLD
jgi:competence ComEA-like helix-hairpin-helix protein